MKYIIDEGHPDTHLVLGICECGSRFLGFDRLAVMNRLARHEENVHPEDRNARENLRGLKWRKRKRTQKKKVKSTGHSTD